MSPTESNAGASPDRERRRGSPLWGVLGVSLALAGAGALILSYSFVRGGSATNVGADAPVNISARSPSDISAHNSPTLARNPVRPANLAVSSRVDTPFFSCGLHVSQDRGASWSQTPIPAPKGEEAKCFAPDVAFAADGTLYLSYVTLQGRGNVPNAVWIATSKDGGRTLSKPNRVRGPLAFQVRLAADPVKPRRVYMTWLQAGDVAPLKFTQPGNPIQVSRSDDGGATWSRPVGVNEQARQRVVTPSPVVGPKGELYVLYLDLGQDMLDYEGGHNGRGGPPYRGSFQLVLARSRDGGSRWEESVVEDRVVPIERFIVFFPPFPSVAVDRSGRIYAAFHDGRLGQSDVLLWTLDPDNPTREGLEQPASAWKGPKRVNDTEERDGTSQYLPKLSVAPGGRLDVVYYDRRSDRRNVQNQVSFQSSFDRGETFTPALHLSSRSFSSKIGFGAKEGLPDLGSRLGLVSDDRQAIALWTDTRAGLPSTQKQDLAKAVVDLKEPSGLSKPVEYLLRYGGLCLVLAGLVLLVLWVTRREPGAGPQPQAASDETAVPSES